MISQMIIPKFKLSRKKIIKERCNQTFNEGLYKVSDTGIHAKSCSQHLAVEIST